MSDITLKQSAVDKLMNDPKIGRWRQDKPARNMPFLGYYRRSYSTSHDGTITEHGDGFMLTTIDPQDADQTRGIVIRPVAFADGHDILVGGEESIMSASFAIGWSQKFTYEPRKCSPSPKSDAPDGGNWIMDFDPAFPLLGKFTVGLPSTPASVDDVRAASAYLGVDVPEGALDQLVAFCPTSSRVRIDFDDPPRVGFDLRVRRLSPLEIHPRNLHQQSDQSARPSEPTTLIRRRRPSHLFR